MTQQPTTPIETVGETTGWAHYAADVLIGAKPPARAAEPSALRRDLRKGRRYLGSIKRSVGRSVSTKVNRSKQSLRPGGRRAITATPFPEASPAETVVARVSDVMSQIRPGQPVPTDLPGALTCVAQLLGDSSVTRGEIWLTFIAVTGRMPETDELDHVVALVSLEGASAATAGLVDIAAKKPTRWAHRARLRIVTFPLVDVSRTAASPLHTGIQRVVREVVPMWAARNELEAVVFDDGLKCYRALTSTEYRAIYQWGSDSLPDEAGSLPSAPEIVVPWNTTVVIPELISDNRRSLALECLGTWSGNRIGMTVHDFIPYTCPSIVGESVRIQFGETFNVIRSSHRLSAVSKAVCDDVDACGVMIENLGLPRPQARAHPHPITAPSGDTDAADDAVLAPLRASTLPIVMTVGSAVPRKNHLRLLQAVEQLWSEGLRFEFVMVGWNMKVGNWLSDEASKLQAKGRPLRYVGRVSDPALGEAYRLAQFTVFVSLAEGYGLPVAESIASGTPVITSNFGSMREIAADGGALTVDPRQTSEIAEAIRTLLQDDEACAQLASQARDRDRGSWDEYSVRTWEWLTGS